ncbi:MAG TPA: hypothetical protein VHJ99_10720, partial [Candidatus Dormibacteraeota bacterium]|nr:hypothetical protein [Candidatus Dormibacteraeota bacterium]
QCVTDCDLAARASISTADATEAAGAELAVRVFNAANNGSMAACPALASMALLVVAAAAAGCAHRAPLAFATRRALAAAAGPFVSGGARFVGLEPAGSEDAAPAQPDPEALRKVAKHIGRQLAPAAPASPWALADAALLRLVTGRFDQAERLFRRAAETQRPGDPRLQSDLCAFYLRIPVEGDHPFQSKATTDSDRRRPLIPA